MTRISDFLRDERGATAAEYSLILVIVAIALVVAIGVLGGKVKTGFNSIGNYVAGT